MKVETDLRAGGALEDALAEIGLLVDNIENLVTEADQDLMSLVNETNLAATSAWDSVASSLSQIQL